MTGIVTVRVEDHVSPKLAAVLRGANTKVINAYADYLMGNERRGLKHYAPYRYVSRKAAYGKTWQSEKQRKYVMMLIKRGIITPGKPNRTRRTASGWQKKGAGNMVLLINRSPGAVWLYDDRRQARQLALVGHRKKTEIIKSNRKGSTRAAQLALNRFVKSKFNH